MSRRWFSLIAVALLAPSAVSAQQRWSATFQAGPIFPTKALSGVDLDPGVGFEATIGYLVYPHFEAYGGWGWHRITTQDFATPFENQGANLEQTGFLLGLRYDRPFRLAGVEPSLVVRAGGTYEHLETGNWDGETTEDSGHGLGAELGAGIGFGIGERWTVIPGLRFRSLRRDLTLDGVTRKVRLDYVALEVGGSFRF
jgi:hypothetical protein